MKPTPARLEEPYRGRAVPPATARYWSWLFSAPELRDALLGIYALTAEWQALRDPATEISAAELKVGWWQEEMRRLAQGSPVHPISRYLADLPRAGSVDFRPLAAAIDAVARQAAGAPLERGSELHAHSAALYANPLLMAARLARGADAAAESSVHGSLSSLAAAHYLAAAAAGYRREANRGRVTFAVDELLAAGIENADLGAAEPSPRLQAYLHDVRARAARLFAAAARDLPPAERAAMRHLLVLAALGAKHLNGGRSDARGFRLDDLYLAWTTARRAARQT
jgi:15-cis-phytoene synthase